MTHNLLATIEHAAAMAWKIVGAVTVVALAHGLAPVLSDASVVNITDGHYWLAGVTGALHQAEIAARSAAAAALRPDPLGLK